MSEEQNIDGKAQDEEQTVKTASTDQNTDAIEETGSETEVEQTDEAVSQLEDEDSQLSDSEKLELLANELAKAQEDVLRAQAEAQNSRRRSEADVERARKFALERFVGDLLPVVDNLDRALEAIDQSDKSFKSVVEGIELTRKSFLDTLTKNQVVQIDPAGEPFDPEIHQAMTMVPNADLEPNTVMEVFQKGYSLNTRLIRPAMVVVSKAVD